LAGPVGQQAKNAMHGVWLRHPLHPVFTDVPIGAWTTGLVLDAVAARTHDPATQQAADVAIGVGLGEFGGRARRIDEARPAWRCGPADRQTTRTAVCARAFMRPPRWSLVGGDGRVINGPATQNQPCLDVRERAGRIEVKRRE